MNSNLRINIVIDNDKEYECMFSNNLSLKENLELLSKILEIKLDDKIIMTYLSNCILNPDLILNEYKFIDGQKLFLY